MNAEHCNQVVAVDDAGRFPDATAVAQRYREVRAHTLERIAGLSAEDLAVQAMPDASPGKWHLAHTSWFFEAMVLQPHCGLPPLQPGWDYLFNSYYEALGARHPRPRRGLLTRPNLQQVLEYRAAVDQRMVSYLAASPTATGLALVDVGLQHEQQHQELLVTDLKFLLAQNPLQPAWRAGPTHCDSAPESVAARTGQSGAAGGAGPRDPALPSCAGGWIERHEGGSTEVGAGPSGFAFDNERPRHRVWLEPFALADRPVTCGAYLRFIEAGGYEDPRWWLADGWAAACAGNWQAPLYWSRAAHGAWQRFSVHGPVPVLAAEPVAHLSYYEADAYARFAGARLPTEAEWEVIARDAQWSTPSADAQLRGQFEPPAQRMPGFGGAVWEWTSSAYAPYPGFKPLPGAVGEYNGKFMSGQMVLRGGSSATPAGHARATYRNFFAPAARWQFSGLRLARDLA